MITMYRKRVLLSDVFVGTATVDIGDLDLGVKQKHTIPLDDPSSDGRVSPGKLVFFTRLLAMVDELEDDDFIVVDRNAPVMEFQNEETLVEAITDLLPVISEYLDLQTFGRLSCVCKPFNEFFKTSTDGLSFLLFDIFIKYFTFFNYTSV